METKGKYDKLSPALRSLVDYALNKMEKRKSKDLR